MPLSVEIYNPIGDKWEYQDMVTPGQEYGTIMSYSGDEQVLYIARCKKDDSKAIINLVRPTVLLTGPIVNAVLYEKGDCENRAVLRKGEAHTELIRKSKGDPASMVKFTQM